MRRVSFQANGDVQGVFYRHFASQQAEKIGVFGWIRNEADGSVKGVIEGDDEAVERFLEWAKEGSPMSTVQDVKITEEKYKSEFNKFNII